MTSEDCDKILIKNGIIINADSILKSDILLGEGKILHIGKDVVLNQRITVINATNCLIMPGGIDANTHFDCSFMGYRTVEDFYSGSRAAVAGGTTMIMDYVQPDDEESMTEAFVRRRQTADENVVCDYSLHMAVTSKTTLEEISDVAKVGYINSLKINMAFDDVLHVADDDMYQVFRTCKQCGLLPMITAENAFIIKENGIQLLQSGISGAEAHYQSRTELAEVEAVHRVCTIARLAKSPIYFCTMMSKSAVETMKARNDYRNVQIFGETIAAALVGYEQFENLSEKLKNAYIRSPPIRQDWDTSVNLMEYLANGTLTVVSSDDCTFLLKDKQISSTSDFQKIPCGVHGVQDRMAIVWEKGVNTGILTPPQFVAVTSANVAKLFNIYPQKGCIAVGSDADIVVWNPNRQRAISQYEQYQTCDYNIYEGMEVHGGPEVVVVRGKICYQNNALKVYRGHGKFIETKPFSKILYFNKDN